jgi:molybdenum cofactor biosynthesis protein B
MAGIDPNLPFVPVRVAVCTVSDTRTLADDTSGQWLVDAVGRAGHQLAARDLVPDDRAALHSRLVAWIEDPAVQVIVTTGGTGITRRDITPEVVEALFDKPIPGFGELFRHLSFAHVGTSTIQSRATAGLARGTLIFALPGSTGACRDAWDGILVHQLDSRHRPCNFVELFDRL